MRSPKNETVSFSAPADAVFQAALGVLQNDKSASLLAAHNTGRMVAARQKAKMSNPKLVQALIEDDGSGAARMHVVVGTDPRTPKALLDGKANEKALKKYVEQVQGAVDGSAPAPASPVPDHFVQGKEQVPWTDPDQDPAIEMGGGFKAMYGL